MCEITKRDGKPCAIPSTFHVHVKGLELWPTAAGYVYGEVTRGELPAVGSRPVALAAGRSVTACPRHLTTAVTMLNRLRRGRMNGFGDFVARDLVTVAPIVRPPTN